MARREKILRGVAKVIDDSYTNRYQSALMRTDGDQQKADYLMDCSYFAWLYGIYQFNLFSKAKKEAMSNKPPQQDAD